MQASLSAPRKGPTGLGLEPEISDGLRPRALAFGVWDWGLGVRS